MYRIGFDSETYCWMDTGSEWFMLLLLWIQAVAHTVYICHEEVLCMYCMSFLERSSGLLTYMFNTCISQELRVCL